MTAELAEAPDIRAIQFSKILLSLARERGRVRVVSSALRPPHPSTLPQGGEGAQRTDSTNPTLCPEIRHDVLLCGLCPQGMAGGWRQFVMKYDVCMIPSLPTLRWLRGAGPGGWSARRWPWDCDTSLLQGPTLTP